MGRYVQTNLFYKVCVRFRKKFKPTLWFWFYIRVFSSRGPEVYLLLFQIKLGWPWQLKTHSDASVCSRKPEAEPECKKDNFKMLHFHSNSLPDSILSLPSFYNHPPWHKMINTKTIICMHQNVQSWKIPFITSVTSRIMFFTSILPLLIYY